VEAFFEALKALVAEIEDEERRAADRYPSLLDDYRRDGEVRLLEKRAAGWA
jgi:hypothetical protein